MILHIVTVELVLWSQVILHFNFIRIASPRIVRLELGGNWTLDLSSLS